MAFSQGAADVGLGLVLLVSAGALASGAFDVGTLALFVAYLGYLSFLPRMVGRMLARRKQAAIAVDRMRQLVAGRDRRQRRPGSGAADRAPPARRAAGRRTGPTRVPLQRARRRRPVGPVPRRRRGPRHLVLACNEVSSSCSPGPSVPARARCCAPCWGWRGRPTSPARCAGTATVLDDRGAFLVPPNAAFLPQVPQLVSDSVRDNVGLGPVDRRRPRPGAGAGRHRRRRRRGCPTATGR